MESREHHWGFRVTSRRGDRDEGLDLFESVYGNTRRIAEAIGSGFAEWTRSGSSPSATWIPRRLRADLLVVADRPTSTVWPRRPLGRAAVDAAGKDPTLKLDPPACGAHLREWLSALPHGKAHAAAFDTRLDAPVLLTGHASATIARRLKRRGYQLRRTGELPRRPRVDPDRRRAGAGASMGRSAVGEVHSTDNTGCTG